MQSFAVLREKGHTMASPAVAYARENQERFLSELKDLLRIPSVSTAVEHKDDVRKAADFVAGERASRTRERSCRSGSQRDKTEYECQREFVCRPGAN